MINRKVVIALLFSFKMLNVYTQSSDVDIKYYLSDVPLSYTNIIVDDDGGLLLRKGGERFGMPSLKSKTTLQKLKGKPYSTPMGIFFDFEDALDGGSLHYGLINYEDTKYPQPVFFRSPATILGGKAFVNLLTLKGRYDMVNWEKNEKGVIGYRVMNSAGEYLYEGRIGFQGKSPFFIDTTLIEGPFINLLHHNSATISFETNIPIEASIRINDTSYQSVESITHHEIHIPDLKPGTNYEYSVHFGRNVETYSFRTAPEPGSREPFTFAYASDSRSGSGGGERSFFGANIYIMKKIMALAKYKESAFIQFTGDLITGYKGDPDEIRLEYANWKRSVEPYAHYMPVMATMGNHESVMHYWALPTGDFYAIDKFPFDKVSAEQLFAENFVMPTNGPDTEDGSIYDPSKRKTDFPSYKENVFFYIYDNVAMVVLNSNYWYSPSTSFVNVTGGNIHGYVMDNQLDWLKKSLGELEENEDIDHVFITIHTPFFPNGGHVNDDMWYGGNNDKRPYIKGKPVEKGIIERRDDLLKVIINESPKVVALLTGDEHNYCKTQITPETNLYPDDWDKPKIKLKRSIYQVNNGAAGAPYYAQEITPWTPFTSGFTTQNALVFFHVQGKNIRMEVLNPDTLDKVDELNLR